MPAKSAELERLLTVREVAVLEAMSEKSIRRRIKAGELSVIRMGRLIRIRPQDLRVSRLRGLQGE